jgi:hypothetical protein
MTDTTPIATAITHPISTGTTEQALLAAVAPAFPELTPAELPQVSGELFRVGVGGVLQVRRMEYAHDGCGYYPSAVRSCAAACGSR